MLAESTLSGTITAEYIYFGGSRIAHRDLPSGNVYYYLSDRLGTARVLTNASGTVVEESDFLPYGTERLPQITNDPNVPDNTYKFTGHERDTESSLDHTLHRQYASNLGRWHSPDPKRGKPANPQSWNRYTYGNNPCNTTDPDGGEVHWNFDYPPLFPGWGDGPLPTTRQGWDDLRKNVEELYNDQWNSLSEDCRKGLSEAHPTNRIRDNVDALNAAHWAEAELRQAAAAHGMDWTTLAGIGIRESNFLPLDQRNGGPGRGIFQIEAGPGGSHEGLISVEDAMALVPAAKYAAHYLDRNFEQIVGAFPGLGGDQLVQALAASWNRGAQGVINAINAGKPIDSITENGNYGSNVMNLMQCFK